MRLEFGSKVLVMGILNVTPDSFSDGGRFFSNDNIASQIDTMLESGADVLSLDWRREMAAAARRIGSRAAVQGNLDPCALHAPPQAIHAMVREIAAAAGPARGHILNLGHGCLPDTPVEGVRAFTAAAKALGS